MQIGKENRLKHCAVQFVIVIVISCEVSEFIVDAVTNVYA